MFTGTWTLLSVEELGKSVLKDLGRQEAKADHPTEQGAQASRPRVAAGAVRFGGFGPLSGQNGISERERKEHRSTVTGERRTQNKRIAGQARFEEFRRLSYQGGPPETARSTAKQTRTGRAGEVRFEGFGPLSGQNGQPERARSTAKQMKSRRARKVRFDGLGQLSGQNGPPGGERSTEAEPREKGAEQLGKPALGKPQKRKVDVTRPNTRHTRRPSMAQSATPATQNPTSCHNRGTASQLRKRVRVTDEEDFRVTDEGLSRYRYLDRSHRLACVSQIPESNVRPFHVKYA